MVADENFVWKQLADRAAESLLSGVPDGRVIQTDIGAEVPLRDVYCLIRAFAVQYQFVRKGIWRYQVCLKTEDYLVPVLSPRVLREAAFEVKSRASTVAPSPIIEWDDQIVQPLYAEDPESQRWFETRFEDSLAVVRVTHEEALTELKRSLPKFITSRIAGFKMWLRTAERGPTGINPPPPLRPRFGHGGFRVHVDSRRHGYVVHASPSILGAFRHFGHPTTPVTGRLPWGLWMFAGDRENRRIVDGGRFDIPQTTRVAVTAF